MIVTRSQLVNEILSWEGTPFFHEGREKGVGVDCAGILIGSAWNLGLLSRDWNVNKYPRQPLPDVTLSYLRDLQRSGVIRRIPISDALPGDFYWIRMKEHPQHFAFRLPGDWVMHAQWKKEKKNQRCVKTRLTDEMMNRVVAAFRITGVKED